MPRDNSDKDEPRRSSLISSVKADSIAAATAAAAAHMVLMVLIVSTDSPPQHIIFQPREGAIM
jgi:hypothetical protein